MGGPPMGVAKDADVLPEPMLAPPAIGHPCPQTRRSGSGRHVGSVRLPAGRILRGSWRSAGQLPPSWSGPLVGCLSLGTLGQSPRADKPCPRPRLPLEGTPWRLRSYLEDEQRQAPPEVAVWMTLRAGELTGHTGCGPLRGRYGTMGEVIRFELVDVPAEGQDCGARADAAGQGGTGRPAPRSLVRDHPAERTVHRFPGPPRRRRRRDPAVRGGRHRRPGDRGMAA